MKTMVLPLSLLGLVGIVLSTPSLAAYNSQTKYKLDDCFSQSGDFITHAELKEGEAAGEYLNLCSNKMQSKIDDIVKKNKS